MLLSKNILPIFLLVVSISTFSCQKNDSNGHGFDLKAWRNDSTGCNGGKLKVADYLSDNSEILKGKSEVKIATLLGVPNNTELYGRGQKFFSYDLNCENEPNNNTLLRLRFNALGQVSEVLFLK